MYHSYDLRICRPTTTREYDLYTWLVNCVYRLINVIMLTIRIRNSVHNLHLSTNTNQFIRKSLTFEIADANLRSSTVERITHKSNPSNKKKKQIVPAHKFLISPIRTWSRRRKLVSYGSNVSQIMFITSTRNLIIQRRKKAHKLCWSYRHAPYNPVFMINESRALL